MLMIRRYLLFRVRPPCDRLALTLQGQTRTLTTSSSLCKARRRSRQAQQKGKSKDNHFSNASSLVALDQLSIASSDSRKNSLVPRYSPGSAWPTHTGVAAWLAKLDWIVWTEARAEVERGLRIFGGKRSLDELIARRVALPSAPIHSVRPAWGNFVKLDLAVPTRVWASGKYGQTVFRPAERIEVLLSEDDLPDWSEEWLASPPLKKTRLTGTVVGNDKDTNLGVPPKGYTLVTLQVPLQLWQAAEIAINTPVILIKNVSVISQVRLEDALKRLALGAGVPFTPLLSSTFPQLATDPSNSDLQQPQDTINKKASNQKAPITLSPLERAILNLNEFILPQDNVSVTDDDEVRSQIISELPVQPPLNRLLNAGQLAVIRDCVRMDNAVTQIKDRGEPKKPKAIPAAGQGAGAAGRGENNSIWAASNLRTISATGDVLPFRLIHGPPGTGKTHTLVELVLQLALSSRPPTPRALKRFIQQQKDSVDAPEYPSKPRRILVTGPSNMSIDVIAARLLDPDAPWADQLAQSGLTILRTGLQGKIGDNVESATIDARLLTSKNVFSDRQDEETSVRQLAKLLQDRLASSEVDPSVGDDEYLFQQGAVNVAEECLSQAEVSSRRAAAKASYSLTKKCDVVMSTLSGVPSLISKGGKFDVLIVDEASQALEPFVLLALQCLSPEGTLIMLGDPHQLPPSLTENRMHPPARALSTRQDTLRLLSNGEAAQVLPLTPLRPSEPRQPASWEMELYPTHSQGMAREEVGTALALARQNPPMPLTLFERLMNQYPTATSLLTTQYRMSRAIMSFPAEAVYGGQLKAHETAANNKLTDLPAYNPTLPAAPHIYTGLPVRLPGNPHVNTNPFNSSVYFFDTSFCGKHEAQPKNTVRRTSSPQAHGATHEPASPEGDFSFVNEFEAMWVMHHVDGLIQRGMSPKQIAVLTPYRAQALWLSSLLRAQHGRDFACGTLDSAQGIEREAVVLSLVRSNSTRTSGFTADPRRLNVAITRAKRHLAIVGDGFTLSRPRSGSSSSLLANWIGHLRQSAVVRSPNPGILERQCSLGVHPGGAKAFVSRSPPDAPSTPPP